MSSLMVFLTDLSILLRLGYKEYHFQDLKPLIFQKFVSQSAMVIAQMPLHQEYQILVAEMMEDYPLDDLLLEPILGKFKTGEENTEWSPAANTGSVFGEDIVDLKLDIDD
ncbi:hypothetical protein KQX54_013543 [Cotesia glomerata]|uniref:Uncharacterized protein n=1 Tax=Cotesia glomerata TaxID=32391 RepID=A0AAV7I2B4_COTGL|nr:hypothetical protein KQX54_013543 [Cotesia glomerata]